MTVFDSQSAPPGWDYEKLRAEAHELIDLATFLSVEGEGVDVTDRQYTIEELAQLKYVLGSMRTGIDVASRALAQAWVEADRFGQATVGEETYYLGINKKVQWKDSDAETDFAAWLITQDAETVAAIVPAYGIRIGQVPEKIRKAFFNEEPKDDQLRIKTKKPKGMR